MNIPTLALAATLAVAPAHAQTETGSPFDAIKKATDVMRALVCPELLSNLGADLMVLQAALKVPPTGEHADIKMERGIRDIAFDRLQEDLAAYNGLKCPAFAQLEWPK